MKIPTGKENWMWMYSYQFTGMDLEHVRRNLDRLREYESNPDTVFNSLDYQEWFDCQGMDVEAIYTWCLEQQKRCRRVLFLIDQGPESTGMKKELDLAVELDQLVTVCVHRDIVGHDWVKPFVDVCDGRLYIFTDYDDLGRTIPY